MGANSRGVGHLFEGTVIRGITVYKNIKLFEMDYKFVACMSTI